MIDQQTLRRQATVTEGVHIDIDPRIESDTKNLAVVADDVGRPVVLAVDMPDLDPQTWKTDPQKRVGFVRFWTPRGIMEQSKTREPYPLMLDPESLTVEKRSAILYGSTNCRLPQLAIYHLVMNKGYTEEQLKAEYGEIISDSELDDENKVIEVEKKFPIPVLIAVGGLSMQGKSFISRLFAAITDDRVAYLNQDGFTTKKESGDGYGKIVEGVKLESDADYSLLLQNLKEYHQQSEVGNERQEWNTLMALDHLCDDIKEMRSQGKWPEYILCDMNGVRPGTRELNTFDALTLEGHDVCLRFNTGVRQDYVQLEPKLDAAIIKKYILGLSLLTGVTPTLWKEIPGFKNNGACYLLQNAAHAKQGLVASMMIGDPDGVLLASNMNCDALRCLDKVFEESNSANERTDLGEEYLLRGLALQANIQAREYARLVSLYTPFFIR